MTSGEEGCGRLEGEVEVGDGAKLEMRRGSLAENGETANYNQYMHTSKQ